MAALTVNTKSRPQAVWNNPEKSFSERICGAIDYLEFKVRGGNAVEACRSIERVLSDGRKYELFRQFFPCEWECSRTSLFKTGFYENHSERTNEFFELVNDRLFPIFGGWYEEPEADFENFTVSSLNIDLCCAEIEYEYLQVGYVAALLIFGRDEEIWEYFKKSYGLKQKDFPEINKYPCDKIWHLEKTGKSGLFLNMFEVADHSTGNPWLDTTNCRYEESYAWDENTLRFLSQSYLEAREMLEKTEILVEMIEANPKEILGEMISLWNEGKISQKGESD